MASDNFGFRRKAGILMPVSSLPSRYGIGSFGKEAYDFVDFLAKCGVKCWQVLPLNPTSYGDSPYQSPASVAGNPYFIDLDILAEDGLITREELKGAIHNTKRVDYGHLFNTRYALLRKAYARFSERGGEATREYRKFLRDNAAWLDDYALFMSLKEHYGHRPWYEWEENHRRVDRAKLDRSSFADKCGFYRWLQFEFYTEWRALVSYAHEKKIVIIGDMPIYVAHDSMDVWAAPEEFLLDDEFMPVLVAGCPPDDFSPDGQLWGNPIYNWEAMELDSFSWWSRRVGAAFRLYDVLRIDHFRGFSGYYSIPFGDENAKGGEWSCAPGLKLFECIRRDHPKAKIIAEDLGFITPDVRELLKETGFPGMKMLQFAFYTEDNEYLPREYRTDNCVVYTGSHDSDATRSWARTLGGEIRARLRREIPRKEGESVTESLIRAALASRANLAVIPIQDFMELGGESRINTPAVKEGNWTWRLSPRYNTARLRGKITAMVKSAKRS